MAFLLSELSLFSAFYLAKNPLFSPTRCAFSASKKVVHKKISSIQPSRPATTLQSYRDKLSKLYPILNDPSVVIGTTTLSAADMLQRFPPIRSISEQKAMPSKGFLLTDPSDLFHFNEFCSQEGITHKVLSKKSRFIKPCHEKRQNMYAARKRRFNGLVRQKIQDIMSLIGDQ